MTIILVDEFLWYAFVVLVLSAPAPRARYLRHKKHIDRTTAAVLFVLAARLVFA
jgi:threonine/homoserine/homoserine lactone efflux protein